MSAFRRTISALSVAKAGSSSLVTGSRIGIGASRASSSSSSSSSASPLSLVSHLDQSSLPNIISTPTNHQSKSLYDHLVDLPHHGVGTRVRQVKWAARGIDIPFGKEFKGPILDPLKRKQESHLCYWEITKARIKRTGEKGTPHGKAWGRLVWRGVLITPPGKEERIRGGLKYSWDAAK